MDAVIFTYTCCFNIPREFDTFPNEKQRISRMNAYIFLSNLLFLYIGFFGFLCYNGIEVKKLKVNTSKSKNAESFYIKQSYIDSNGKSTSRTIRKLGTLKELLVEHGPTGDDVMAWAKCDLIQSELYRNFLIYFLAPFIYRLLEKKLERKYTCKELLSTLVE